MRSTCNIQLMSYKKAQGCDHILENLVYFDMLAIRSSRLIKYWPLPNMECWISQKPTGKSRSIVIPN